MWGICCNNIACRDPKVMQTTASKFRMDVIAIMLARVEALCAVLYISYRRIGASDIPEVLSQSLSAWVPCSLMWRKTACSMSDGFVPWRISAAASSSIATSRLNNPSCSDSSGFSGDTRCSNCVLAQSRVCMLGSMLRNFVQLIGFGLQIEANHPDDVASKMILMK